MTNNNLELWNKVEKTNPKYTKKAKVGGNNITAISPQFQIMNATEQFGSYGRKWGFTNIKYDYSLTNTPIKISITDYNTKAVSVVDTILGLVGFKATFFYPEGQFEISNSIKIFTDNKHSKIDDNYAKKLETDTLTKALSKLGFNADIFLGKFDDVRYLEDVTNEFKAKEIEENKGNLERLTAKLNACKTKEDLLKNYASFTSSEKSLSLDAYNTQYISILKYSLEACTTIEELASTYKSFTKQEQAATVAKKDELKEKLNDKKAA